MLHFFHLCVMSCMYFSTIKIEEGIFCYCCWLVVRWITGLKGALQCLFLLDFWHNLWRRRLSIPAFKMFLTQRGKLTSRRHARPWLALTGTSSIAENDMFAVALLSYFTCLLSSFAIWQEPLVSAAACHIQSGDVRKLNSSRWTSRKTLTEEPFPLK